MYRSYFCYLLRHKWCVLCTASRYGVSLWQALIHDWSRFLPDEFLPSARHFAQYGFRWKEGDDPPYDTARLLHETRNPHHWRYWNGQEIPDRYIREMLCDMDAAGQAKGNPLASWWAANGHTFVLHPGSRQRLEEILATTHRTHRVYHHR